MEPEPEPASPGQDPAEEIAALVLKLQETQERLQELTGGEIDAVLAPGGQSYLLQKAQEKLRESEERFRNMFTAAATGIAISTPQGRYLHANAAYCRMLGYTEEELRERDFASLTYPDDLTLNLKLRDELLAGQRESILLEKRYLNRNGDIVWTRHSVSATHAVSGEISTLMVVAEDITERKLAEEDLQRRQTELQVLFDLMPAMIWFKDTQNTILRVNQRVAKATGKLVEEIEGKSMSEVYPQEAAKCHKDDLEVIHSRMPKLGIIEILRGLENQELWVQTDKVPVCDKDGKVTGIIVMAQDITERKRVEEKLNLFRTLIEGIPDAIEVIEPETGRYLDINETGCQRLGYSREEMLAMNVADIGVERDYWAVWPEVAKEIKKVGFATIFERHRRKDGSTFPVEVNARYLNIDQGYLVAVVRDITERKQMESRFRRLVDSNVQGVIFWNTNGIVTGANDAFLRLTGYTQENVAGGDVSWAEMTPPELAARDQIALKELASTGVCGSFEKEFICKDGSRVPVLVGAAMFEDNPNEGLCFVVDLTERKRLEARYRRLVDSNAQGVMFWKETGEIVGGNEAFLRLVGYTREDLEAGRIDWKAMTPPEYHAADQRALEELAAGSVLKPLEKEWIRKDGSRVPILLGAAIFEDNPNEGVCFALDLSERKKLEQQFLRAQRMESIGTLAGGVAHDLNNILAPIMMSIAILKSTSDSPQTREILDTLEVSAQRGADIVRQVLSFARGMEGQRVEIQSKHLLKDMENIIRDTFPKDVEMRFSIPNDTWPILGDPTQVHQILLNLCVNARDAMPNGGKLTIGVENTTLDEHYAAMNIQAKPGRYVKICVTDSGTGIPQNIIDKIFEPFFTTKELNKGTGLGLSTVMAIVKSHEGVVNVYSIPGKGTTFNVYLPAAETSSEAHTKKSEQVNLPRGNGETILVVDDEASILTITRQTLQAFGYLVLMAKDGAEAVAIYAERKNEIAVVLTDMMMPVMDGSSVIRVLTRINPAIKIIAASGLAANGSGNPNPGTRIKHFLTKPYTAETLLKTLRAILEEA
jgi:PAS domain S-box-containing protein